MFIHPLATKECAKVAWWSTQPCCWRTSNLLERLSDETKRHTRLATLFPNTDACLRLVIVMVLNLFEEWQTGRRYLSFEER